MEFIFELIIEVVLGLVTDSGVEVMTGSEETKKWPKPVRIFCVVTTIILSATVIGVLLVYGIILMIKGHVAVGVLLLVVGAILLIMAIVKLRKAYILYKSKQH